MNYDYIKNNGGEKCLILLNNHVHIQNYTCIITITIKQFQLIKKQNVYLWINLLHILHVQYHQVLIILAVWIITRGGYWEICVGFALICDRYETPRVYL